MALTRPAHLLRGTRKALYPPVSSPGLEILATDKPGPTPFGVDPIEQHGKLDKTP